MNIFHLISSAPIIYEIPGYDLYDSFDLVSQGVLAAPLQANAVEVIGKTIFPFDISSIKIVYTASFGQTLDTAHILRDLKILSSDARIVPCTIFDGVRFSMKQLMPKEEFLTLPGHVALGWARIAFISKLYHNELLESLDSVKERIAQVLDISKKAQGETLAISHSFFIRLIEIFITDPACFNNEERLIKVFCPEGKPYEYLTGFDI